MIAFILFFRVHALYRLLCIGDANNNNNFNSHFHQCQAMRKLRYFEYFYCDYFILIRIQSTEINNWRENQRTFYT